MANSNAETLAPNLERTEVDTALPFESVRAAVSLFGSQIGAKKATFLEKRPVQDAERLHAQEELLRLKELLETSEREKDKALHELGQAKEVLKHADEDVQMKPLSKGIPKEGFASDPHKYGQMLMESEDKYVVWESKLQFASEKHTAALAEMESAKQQLADLKQELLASSIEKDCVFKQTENALMAMEGSMKGAECLTTELGGVHNWLSILKHASFDVCSKEKIGAKNVKSGLNGMNIRSQGFDVAPELEFKLLSMMNESFRIREELKCAKDEEGKALLSASDVLVILEAMRVELEKKDQKQEGLKGRSYNRASLLAILEALKMQAEALQKEVHALREREAKTEAKLGALNTELEDARAASDAARAEAEKTPSQLSLALKQAEADAEKGKTKIAALQEEISLTRCRTAAVEAKAIVSVSQLTQALKQSEADLAEAKIEITTLLKEAFKAADRKPIAEASFMGLVLKQSDADLAQPNIEIEGLQDEVCKAKDRHVASMESFAQSFQELKQVEAKLERTKVDMQALQEELSQVQIDNAVEIAEAKGTIAQLLEALKQAEGELEIVKAGKEALQGDLSQIRSCNAVEVAKAEESLAQLSQALKQADKETAVARAEVKSLKEGLLIGKSKDDSSLIPMHEVAFSQEITQEAMVITGSKEALLVSARMPKASQAEVGRLNEDLDLRTRNVEALQDVDCIKSVLKQALHRAEMAEIGKVAAESELKRLREREEHRRRAKATALAAQQNLAKNSFIASEEISAWPSKKPHVELLGSVLNINISAERTKTLVQVGSRKLRKANTSSSTGIYASSKKTVY